MTVKPWQAGAEAVEVGVASEWASLHQLWWNLHDEFEYEAKVELEIPRGPASGGCG